VRKNNITKNETDDRIEAVVKIWLHYASDRNGGRKERVEKKKRTERPTWRWRSVEPKI
jgi:hypothetical protein